MAIGLGAAVQGKQGSQLDKRHPGTKRLLSLVNSLNIGELEEQAVNDAFKEGESLWTDVVNRNVTQERLPNRQSIGRDQGGFPQDMVQTMFPNEPAVSGETTQAIDANIEDEIAEDFARLKGVTTLDVERNPDLRDEYARYLGQRTRTFDNERYHSYDAAGVSTAEKAPTMYRTPTRLTELNRLKYPDETSTPKLAERSKGDEDAIKYKLIQYGATKKEADRIWDQYKNFDTETNVIADNLDSLANTATTLAQQDDYPAFIDGIQNMANKVHFAVQHTMLGNTPAMAPTTVERFVDKITDINPDVSRQNAKEFLFTFMASYGSVA